MAGGYADALPVSQRKRAAPPNRPCKRQNARSPMQQSCPSISWLHGGGPQGRPLLRRTAAPWAAPEHLYRRSNCSIHRSMTNWRKTTNCCSTTRTSRLRPKTCWWFRRNWTTRHSSTSHSLMNHGQRNRNSMNRGSNCRRSTTNCCSMTNSKMRRNWTTMTTTNW